MKELLGMLNLMHMNNSMILVIDLFKVKLKEPKK